MRPRDMTICQRPTGGWQLTFENRTELVTIEASAERLRDWARRIEAVTAAAVNGGAEEPATGRPA